MRDQSIENLDLVHRNRVAMQNRFTNKPKSAQTVALNQAHWNDIKCLFYNELQHVWGGSEMLGQLFFFSLSLLPITRYTSQRLPELANRAVPAGAEVVVEEMQSQLLLNQAHRLSIRLPSASSLEGGGVAFGFIRAHVSAG